MENEIQVVTTKEVESLVIELRGQKVLLDRDVAALYGTETREIKKLLGITPRSFRKITVLPCKYLKNSMWWKISTGCRALKSLL